MFHHQIFLIAGMKYVSHENLLDSCKLYIWFGLTAVGFRFADPTRFFILSDVLYPTNMCVYFSVQIVSQPPLVHFSIVHCAVLTRFLDIVMLTWCQAEQSNSDSNRVKKL